MVRRGPHNLCIRRLIEVGEIRKARKFETLLASTTVPIANLFRIMLPLAWRNNQLLRPLRLDHWHVPLAIVVARIRIVVLVVVNLLVPTLLVLSLLLPADSLLDAPFHLRIIDEVAERNLLAAAGNGALDLALARLRSDEVCDGASRENVLALPAVGSQRGTGSAK